MLEALRLRHVAPTLLLCVFFTAPAAADFKCRTWTSLDEEARQSALEAAIERVVTGHDARKYGSIDKVRVRRCLEGRIPLLVDRFDGVCAEGRAAPLQGLNREFERAVWSCVGRRER